MPHTLFVDILSTYGHANFNNLFIKNLLNDGHKVDIILREYYKAEHKLDGVKKLWNIGENEFRFSGKIGERINSFFILLKLRKYLKYNYDYIIFSNFDEITFYFANLKGNIFLVNHANLAESIINPIKSFFLRLVLKKHTLLVFSQEILDQCLKMEINNVMKMNQGIPDKILISKNKALNIIQSRLNILNKKLIYIPSIDKFGDSFIYNLLKSKKFMHFVKKNNYMIICKGNIYDISDESILFLKPQIENVLYKSILKCCSLALIYYPKSFKLRVSAFLLECLANDIPCLLSDIDSFRPFQKYFNYDPFFITTDDVQSRIEDLISFKGNFYENLNELGSTLPKF